MTCGKAEDGGGRNPAGPETALPCHGKAGHHPQHHPQHHPPAGRLLHPRERESRKRAASGSARAAPAPTAALRPGAPR